MHQGYEQSGVPVIVFNRGGTFATSFPGVMIAPADATRQHLTIQAAGFYQLTIYPRSGSDPINEVGINLIGPAGVAEFTRHEDPEMVVAEWWAYTDTVNQVALSVTEEIFR